jgi:hypothetical protein
MGHVAEVGEMRNAHKILVQYLKRRSQLGNLGIDARITLKYFMKK